MRRRAPGGTTLIIGAGFAGIATAYHLARRGARDIVVVEREAGPGMHASGRNAGLLRQSCDDAATAAILREGARAARRIAARIPGAIQTTGSLILGGAVERLETGPRARVVEAGDLVLGLAGPALFDPEDALIDPQALLGAYLAGARRRGVVCAFNEAVEEVTRRDGRVVRVETSKRQLDTDRVVVAAGAWASEVAGTDSVSIEPRRRHLFRGSCSAARDDWPFVWHEGEGVYFRTESGGVLMSACDVEPHPVGEPQYDERQREVLAARLGAHFDEVGEWRIGTGWACLRCFAPDERFVIGADPGTRGLFWVAGLGGHGVTASWAVGRLAARVILGEATAGPFDPARF
ncbi:MAG: NAD(P)/FAD-dependent oxidoreductase [Planctomycetota bacterium]|jgi:D-arginine dehydrogenase